MVADKVRKMVTFWLSDPFLAKSKSQNRWFFSYKLLVFIQKKLLEIQTNIFEPFYFCSSGAFYHSKVPRDCVLNVLSKLPVFNFFDSKIKFKEAKTDII